MFQTSIFYFILEKSFCERGLEHGKGKKNDNYQHPKHCGKFISCQNFEHGTTRNSIATIQSCSYGLFFNDKIKVCDWPRNVECYLYQGKTCYGSYGEKYGTFKSSQTGYLSSLKLIHLDGYVTCKYYKPTYKSFWGCNSEDTGFKYLVNTWITKSNDQVIFPVTTTTPYDIFGNYKLEGFDQLSGYLKWDADKYDPIMLQQGEELKIWYGEDYNNIHEFDNDGEHCVEVYALFSYYNPFYFMNRNKRV